MRRIFSLLLVTVVFLLVSLEGCKKYPDGPRISFRGKAERLAGLWHIVSIQIDGTEQNLSQPVGQMAPYDKQTFEFTKEGNVVWTWDSYSGIPGLNYTGEWKFNDDKSSFLVKMDGETDWKEKEILKLKNNELWYKENSGNSTTEVHLESY